MSRGTRESSPWQYQWSVTSCRHLNSTVRIDLAVGHHHSRPQLQWILQAVVELWNRREEKRLSLPDGEQNQHEWHYQILFRYGSTLHLINDRFGQLIVFENQNNEPSEGESEGPFGHGMICSCFAVIASLFAISAHSESGQVRVRSTARFRKSCYKNEDFEKPRKGACVNSKWAYGTSCILVRSLFRCFLIVFSL